MLAGIGILAGLVALIDTVPYIRDIRRGRTRPQRATWLIWSVLGVAAFAAQAAGAANWGLIMIGTQAVLMATIFIMAIPTEVGGMRAIDLTMLALAGAGLVGWIVDAPVVATISVVIADSLGVALMLPKTWRDPESAS